MIAGNNGSGKTTFIGKFIHYFQQNSLKPGVIAADTFRAAAIEQLEFFANKFEIPIVKGQDKEPSSGINNDLILGPRSLFLAGICCRLGF